MRELENVPGAVFDAGNTQTLYAEDWNEVIGNIADLEDIDWNSYTPDASGAILDFFSGISVVFLNGTLTFNDANSMSFVWEFPISFSATPVIVGSHGDSSSVNNTNREAMSLIVFSADGDGCDLRIYRATGAAAFQAGDTMNFSAIVIGVRA